jgi:predicted Holliday junction resolvase-like endonuclease
VFLVLFINLCTLAISGDKLSTKFEIIDKIIFFVIRTNETTNSEVQEEMEVEERRGRREDIERKRRNRRKNGMHRTGHNDW